MLFRIRGLAGPVLFAATSLLSGIHFGPEFDPNFQLTNMLIMTTVGFLMLAHVDRRPAWALPAVIVSVVAILGKFNIGVACTGSLMVWALIQLYHDRSKRMLGRLSRLALVYVGSLTLLFWIYGGSPAALGKFFKYSGQVASAYASQMSYSGPVAETVVFSSVMVLATLAVMVGIPLRARYTPALLIILFPMFMGYKTRLFATTRATS